MNLRNISKILAIFPLILGFLGNPTSANAGFGDFFNLNSSNSYDANAIIGQHNGEIRLSKRVRRVTRDQDYHETTTVRSGDLVEVWIEVKNTSGDRTAFVTVTDQLGGSVVYKTNSLRLNGQSTPPGLTSGGIGLNMPPRTTAIITYEIYVCGGSSSAIRANAYAAGVGSATDAVIIESENQQYSNYYSNNDVSTCMNQLQNAQNLSASNASGSNSNNYNTNNAAGNPFAGWTGVNNANNTTANNPFEGWTGVNNATPVSNTNYNTSASSNAGNPFGTWTGVQNNTSASNPFGDWTGVQNDGTTSNPFGDWRGVQNSDTVSNPFGDWTGVNNANGDYDMRGYSTNSSSDDNQTQTVSRADNSSTYFVAPTTGINKTAPLWFAGLFTAAFLLFKKRNLLFT